jgi:hypothetical protein
MIMAEDTKSRAQQWMNWWAPISGISSSFRNTAESCEREVRILGAAA